MSASKPPTSPLIQALERILSHWQAKAPTVAQSLRSGLSRKQIETQLQNLPFRVPEEVYQLYQWRNGSEDRRGLAHQVEFMPQYLMLSLEEAIAEYEAIQEMLLFDFEDEEEVEESKTFWFPLFARDSDYYVIQGDIESKATAPIFDFSAEIGLELSFNSLTDMMLAIAECFETGAYSIDDYSYLDWDDLEEEQIWFKYQPHLIAKADTILNTATISDNQARHLSSEERREAYSALAKSQHPQALSLLIQAVEELEANIQHLLFQVHNAPTVAEKADALEELGAKEEDLRSLIRDIRKTNTPEAVQYLLNLIKRNDSEIRDIAIERLANDATLIRDQSTEMANFLFLILQQYSSSNFEITSLLRVIAGSRTTQLLLTLLQQAISCSFNLNQQVPVQLETFVQINRESFEWKPLLRIVEILGTLGDSRAVDPLFQLTQQQRDPTIRLAAGKALSALGDPRAREIFTRLLEEGAYTRLHFEQMGIEV